MPFYDFICSQCGKVFDRMLSIDHRNEEQVCPDCGGLAVRKEVSRFSAGGNSSHSHDSGSCGGG